MMVTFNFSQKSESRQLSKRSLDFTLHKRKRRYFPIRRPSVHTRNSLPNSSTLALQR